MAVGTVMIRFVCRYADHSDGMAHDSGWVAICSSVLVWNRAVGESRPSKWMALGIQLYLGVRSLTACFLLRLQWQSHQSQFAYLPDTSICPAVWQPVLCEFLSPLQVEFA